MLRTVPSRNTREGPALHGAARQERLPWEVVHHGVGQTPAAEKVRCTGHLEVPRWPETRGARGPGTQDLSVQRSKWDKKYNLPLKTHMQSY